ncbi:MAG: hypothetical protein KAS78_02750 [Candidatus Pacebacteria bacterium]|nr:hypothetical protein [Candidatus Paceibacterota bacterium]
MKLIDDKTIKYLIESLNLDSMSEENKNEVLTEALGLISKRAGVKIMENFSEEEITEFESISESDLEKMEEFLIAKNSDAKKIFDKEVKITKDELLKIKLKIKA